LSDAERQEKVVSKRQKMNFDKADLNLNMPKLNSDIQYRNSNMINPNSVLPYRNAENFLLFCFEFAKSVIY